jgi:hypothetical protein
VSEIRKSTLYKESHNREVSAAIFLRQKINFPSLFLRSATPLIESETSRNSLYDENLFILATYS